MERYAAFEGHQRVADGDLPSVVQGVKAHLGRRLHHGVLVFDNRTGQTVEVDFRGTLNEVLARLAPPQVASTITNRVGAPVGPGRPKLGVVAREVTLLPRHWEWLAAQPGGASVTLRRLVEEARRAGADQEEARQAMDAADRFLRTMAGDLPGFEEAYRAFYRKDRARFDLLIADWPADIRDHLVQMVEPVAWSAPPPSSAP